MSSSRDLFAREGFGQIPKVLTLLDRNRHSPTYGCFDRNYWHYKIIDFPSGMAQEFVLPLALAYTLKSPLNPFFEAPSMREWAEAGILFAARHAHSDGSCDDYYPYERALGAAAFSLLACTVASFLLDLRNDEVLRFLERRGNWLARREESGKLSNHHALVVLCLGLLSRLLNTPRWDRARRARLERLLSWQSREGWFPEYEGCDPGYNTLTISSLAWLHQLDPDPRIEKALRKAVEFSAEIIHPDGSFGGEYASRNTYNFFPHGFEWVGRWFPRALEVNDLFLEGLSRGLGPCYADDHIIGHHTWSYLLAFRDFVPDRPAGGKRAAGRLHFREAGLVVDRRDDLELYMALNKGGVFKLFRFGRLVASDTQFSLQVTSEGKERSAVAHLVSQCGYDLSEEEIVVRGNLGWAKQTLMTPLRLMLLRVVMLTAGRLFPDLIRRLLQKLLIVGKDIAPFAFQRAFCWRSGKLCVSDELRADSWQGVKKAAIGCDQTSIYVVMSRTYQAGQLQPWLDLTDRLEGLSPGETLKIEREL